MPRALSKVTVCVIMELKMAWIEHTESEQLITGDTKECEEQPIPEREEPKGSKGPSNILQSWCNSKSPQTVPLLRQKSFPASRWPRPNTTTHMCRAAIEAQQKSDKTIAVFRKLLAKQSK